MRKWMIGVLALAGSALVAVPGAMAQSEWGTNEADELWDEFGTDYNYYSPPIGRQLYGYRPLARVTPPGVAPATRVYRYRATPPGVSYFSPPGAGVETEVEVGPGPGQCGTNFYWSDAAGGCVDARLR